MHRIIEWFVRNPVAANLLMMILVISGFISLSQLRQEEFPPIDLGLVVVSVPYLGAAPEEVERGVCIRIEEALEGTLGIYRMTSNSLEGVCNVNVELEPRADDVQALNDIKSKVDAISTFPVETERPIVTLATIRRNALEVAISGPADERSLKELALRVREDIAELDGISDVEVTYVRPDEISIEISEQTLRRMGLSLGQIANAVRRSSLDLPGGSIRTDGGEILVRTQGQAYRGRDFEDIVAISRIDGTSIRLADIATIIDGFQEGDTQARLNGNPAAIVRIRQVESEDLIQIRDQVRAYVADMQVNIPEGLDLTILRDESEELEARLNILLGTAAGGLVLVLTLLTLPLQFRLAMWVAAGIPIAMLGTLAMFTPFDITINTLSVFAFILVLGVVVDDAIVVGERVFAHERMQKGQLRAAIDGTSEVAVPVIFGVLTTIAAFIPIIFTPGRIGQLFSVMGYVVVLCLIFSIVESQLILPAHLAHRRTKSRGEPNAFVKKWTRFQKRLSARIEDFAEHRYGAALVRVTSARYLALACGVGTLMIVTAYVLSGRLPIQFFPNVEGDRLAASLTLPEGVHVEQTAQAAERIERAALELRARLRERYSDRGDIVEDIFTSVGQGIGGQFGPPRSNLAQVVVALVPTSERGNIASGDLIEGVARADGRDSRCRRTDVFREPGHRPAMQSRFSCAAATLTISPLLRPKFAASSRGSMASPTSPIRSAPASKRSSSRCALKLTRSVLTLSDLGTPGAPGVLRRGSATRAARHRGHPHHGALSGSGATIARRSRGHADSHRRRHRGAVRSSCRVYARPRLFDDSTYRSPTCRHGACRRQPRCRRTRSGHRRTSSRCATANSRALPRCHVRAQRRAGRACDVVSRHRCAFPPRTTRDLCAARDPTAVVRAAARDHECHSVRRRRCCARSLDHGLADHHQLDSRHHCAGWRRRKLEPRARRLHQSPTPCRHGDVEEAVRRAGIVRFPADSFDVVDDVRRLDAADGAGLRLRRQYSCRWRSRSAGASFSQPSLRCFSCRACT